MNKWLNSTQLFYKDGRLRMAISTANFVDYDWRDNENVRCIKISLPV